MTQDLKSGNGSTPIMGDPVNAANNAEDSRNQEALDEQRRQELEAKRQEELNALIFADLESIKSLTPERAVEMLQLYLIQRREGAYVPLDYRSLKADELIAQHGGNAHEAVKRLLNGLFLLDGMTEGKILGNLPNDVPPVLHKILTNLVNMQMRPLSEDMRVARLLAAKDSAYEQGYRHCKELLDKSSELSDRLLKTPPVDTQSQQLQAALDLAEKRIEHQNKQILTVKNMLQSRYDQKEAELRKALAASQAKDGTISALTVTNEDLTKDKERLTKEKEDLEKKIKDSETKTGETVVRVNKNMQSYENLVKTQKEQLAYERENNQKLAKEVEKLEKDKEGLEKDKRGLENTVKYTRPTKIAGWVAAAAASLLAAGIWFYRPAQSPVENVPQEVHYRSKDEYVIKFGSTTYHVKPERYDEIEKEMKLEIKKVGRQLTPAERKRHYDSKESVRTIK